LVQAGDLTGRFDTYFYGYIKVDAVYMDAKAVQSNYLVLVPPGNLHDGFKPFEQNEDFTKNKEDSSFSVTARQSRFGFKIKGPGFGKEGQILGRLEMDFYGQGGGKIKDGKYIFEDENKGNLMLRIATIELKNKNLSLLVGNDWMVMSPLYPHVSNYTYGAEMGNLGYRMPQIRLTGYLLDGKLALMTSAGEKIGDYSGFFDVDTGDDSAQPDIQAGICWNSKLNGKPLKVGVTGHYAQEELGSDLIADNHKHRVESWSYNFHLSVPITKWLTISGEWFQGANLDGWYTGGVGQGWVETKDGEYEALKDTGGWAEIGLGPFKGIQIFGGYGVDDVDDDQLEDAVRSNAKDKDEINKSITKNSMYYASVHYWLVPKVMDISLEWMQARTEYGLARVDKGASTDLDDGVVNRYTLSFWFFFY